MIPRAATDCRGDGRRAAAYLSGPAATGVPMLLAFLLACSGEKAEPAPAPTVTWLVPQADSTVAIGELTISLVVDYFNLETPALHSVGEASGYMQISLDSTVVLETGLTTPTVNVDEGAHTLTAQLLYEDGDEVTVADDLLCEEGDEGCEPVIATVMFYAATE